ncbi:MAG: DUF2478 domain-containing protein, partial [Pseudomonadota bacterium]
LIINKFGKHEGDGRGFRPLIAEAIAQDVPVLIGVNGLNMDRFNAFTGGEAEQLTADTDSIVAWFKRVSAQRTAAA